MSMELRHLRYFIQAAELQHFTRAARALHVSQPTLSLQIRQLEEEVGAPLFERVGRHVRLTEPGELFYSYARRALRELEAGQQGINELKGLTRGVLSLGVTYSLSARLLPPLLVAYAGQHPGVRLSVTVGNTSEVEQGLLAGRFDVGFAYLSAKFAGLTAAPLFEEDVVVVLQAGHPLAQREALRWGDLLDLDWVLASEGYSTRRLIDEHLARAGLSPRIVLESSDVDVLLSTVRLGLGITLVSRRTAQGFPGIVSVPLKEAGMVRTAALLWRESGYRSVAARRFCDLAAARLAPG
jgi:LysR family cyn operon transcriptional activator